MLISLLESIKKEVEGDIVINGKIEVNVEQTINMQIQQQIFKDLNITSLVLARVAAKHNVDPVKLMTKLALSQYAKFAGFEEPDVSREDDTITYPSQISYDLDAIRKIAEANESKEEREIEGEQVVVKKADKSVKAKLIAKINKNKEKKETVKDKLLKDLDKKKEKLNGANDSVKRKPKK